MKKFLPIIFVGLWIAGITINKDLILVDAPATGTNLAISAACLVFWVVYVLLTKKDENLLTMSYYLGLYCFIAGFCLLGCSLIGYNYGGLFAYLFLILIGPFYGLISVIPSVVGFSFSFCLFTFVVGAISKIWTYKAI